MDEKLQTLLSSPQALIGTVWERRDYGPAGFQMRIRRRYFVIAGFSHMPFRSSPGEPLQSRLWVSGWSLPEEGSAGYTRPFHMLLESLQKANRYTQTDRLVDVMTGEDASLELTVHENTLPEVAPRTSRKPKVRGLMQA